MNLTFDDELEQLLELIDYKQYRRRGDALLVPRGSAWVPECTIREMVWGWCKNPCYANALVAEISATIPDYAVVLGAGNHAVSAELVFDQFDDAMKAVTARSDDPPDIAYSTETSEEGTCHSWEDDPRNDTNFLGVRSVESCTNDGELWHGVCVPDDWEDALESVTVTILPESPYRDEAADHDEWCYTFSARSAKKRVYNRGGVRVFQPFRHPFPHRIINHQVVVQAMHRNRTSPVIKNLYGITSTGLANWLATSVFQLRLCKRRIAKIDASGRTVQIIKTK